MRGRDHNILFVMQPTIGHHIFEVTVTVNRIPYPLRDSAGLVAPCPSVVWFREYLKYVKG